MKVDNTLVSFCRAFFSALSLSWASLSETNFSSPSIYKQINSKFYDAASGNEIISQKMKISAI